VPILLASTELGVRHLAIAGALALTAALFMPAVAIFAASLVAVSQTERMAALRVAAGIDAVAKHATTQPPAPSTAMLGALPGFASTIVIVGILLTHAWLVGRPPAVSAWIVLTSLASVSALSILTARAGAPRIMGTILRDVSALDRQRLATLEIRAPTAIERGIARLLGDAALPYSKDARLMRRRYPMAFALGALIFLVLAIVGISQPTDPTPWLVATLVSASAYGLAVGARLHRAPIELPRLSSTLPFSASAAHRAKVAWVIGWWMIFIALPALFASLRQPSPLEGLALLGGGSMLVIGSALLRRA
jgi:hypothetical protein